MPCPPRSIVPFFLAGSSVTRIAPLGDGNVNDTWHVVKDTGRQLVLQRLNGRVFPDPAAIQQNLTILLRHIHASLSQQDASFTMPRLIKTTAGRTHILDSDGDLWRMLSFINNTSPVNTVSRPAEAREIGRGLAIFHDIVSTLPPAALVDPLPGFHQTPLYLRHYDAIAVSPAGKPDSYCHNFITRRRDDAALLEQEQARQALGFQIIHGDPKVANFLFSRDGRVVSLIDLDTVKPGLLLHDLGDALRSCCNPLGEELQPHDEIFFDPKLFRAMLEGYCSRAAHLLTRRDRELMAASTRLISFELGIRFYSDHLQGNTYFKVTAPGQNLFRARLQFALVRSIEEQYTALQDICAELFENNPILHY